MDIFKKISGFVGRQKTYITNYTSFLSSENKYQPTDVDYLDSYSNCHLVFTCAKKIGEATANVKRRMYKIKGNYGKEIVVEVKDHPVLDLLDKPNKFMTGFEMMKGISIDLDLSGNSYILKVQSERGKVVELWPLRPDWVKIISDEKEVIKGYEYRVPGAEAQTYTYDEVLHIKEANPQSSFYGMPTVKPMMEVVRNLVYAIRWNMNFFYNSARPDFVVFTKTRMLDKDREEFKKSWKREFGGLENSHRFGLLYGEDTKLENLTQSTKDMEFNELIETATTQILAAFGVPKSIVGMMGMNRAEAEAQIYTFLSETVEPRYKMINEKLNEFLIPAFGDNLYLDYVDPTPENREAIVKEYESALTHNWMVINEVRDKEGLPPLEGGWDFYLPVSMIPAGGTEEGDRSKAFRVKGIDAKTYYDNKKKKENDILKQRVMAGKKKLKTTLKLKSDLVKIMADRIDQIKKLTFSSEKKQDLWNEHVKLLTGSEKTYKTMVVGLFESQRKRALSSLSKSKKIKGELNWEEEKRLFAKVSLPFVTTIVESRGKKAASLIGSTFEITPDVTKFINDKVFLFADQVNNTTQKKLRKTLTEGLDSGEGIPALKKRVNVVFDTRTGAESERIARTEVLGSSNGAELEAYKQTDIVQKIEWLATMDDRTRSSHASMNGEKVLKGKSFSNGLKYPSEPNCRCTLLPVIE